MNALGPRGVVGSKSVSMSGGRALALPRHFRQVKSTVPQERGWRQWARPTCVSVAAANGRTVACVATSDGGVRKTSETIKLSLREGGGYKRTIGCKDYECA